MSAIKVDVFGQLSAKKRLQLLQLPPAKRRQLLGGMGREVKRACIRRIRAQQDVNGKPWEPRKRGPGRKLLRHMNRKMRHTVNADFFELHFQGAASKIAAEQQYGMTQTLTAQAVAKEQGHRPHYDDPATKQQAKALREAGYKIRVAGTKRWRKPSLKWITQNQKQKQAGLVLKILRDDTSKKSWTVTLPARPFVGVTEHEINTFVEKIFDNTVNARA